MKASKAERVRNVHPFPARMAPDIALNKIAQLTKPGAIVLDPMCGSGTVPRMAVIAGRNSIASDMDPLSVLMTRTACKPSLSRNLGTRAEEIVARAKRLGDSLPPWITGSEESSDFVAFWFAAAQRFELSRLARVLAEESKSADPLRIALSRIIVTKSGGASLARDTSHSRPHRVGRVNDFDVFSEFIKSAKKLEGIVGSEKMSGSARIRTADARSLNHIERASVDLILTSPPYLNAIDYLRGHKLSLIWLGWTIGEIRTLRGETIGTEKTLKLIPESVASAVRLAIPGIKDLSNRDEGMIYRFASDMDRLNRSMGRVSKLGGHMVLVVADSTLKGVKVSNSDLAIHSAERYGFRLTEKLLRELPIQHRYLPLPDAGKGPLGSRMREELVLTFQKCK